MNYDSLLSSFRDDTCSWLDQLIRSSNKELLDTSSDKEQTDRIVNDIEKISMRIGLANTLDNVTLSLLANAKGGRPMRILETCCGNGWYLRHLEQKLKSAGIPAQLIGLDICADSIATAAQKSQGSSIEWMVGDATNLPYDEGELTLTLNIQSLHHFSPALTVELIGESLRASQALFFFDLRRTYLGFLLVKLLRPFASADFIHDASLSHRRAYRIEELRYLMSNAGLGVHVDKLTQLGLSITAAAAKGVGQ